MLVSRIFLAIVGLTYIYLSVWCSLQPVQTSQLVGFDLKPGSGQSEFLVIYGGLELGLALLLLWPFVRPKQLQTSLQICLIVHACLVLFRTASFLMYTGISSMTRNLAFYEWLIFLAAAGLVWKEAGRNRI